MEPDLEEVLRKLREEGPDDRSVLAALDVAFRASQEWVGVIYGSLNARGGVDFTFDSGALRQASIYLRSGETQSLVEALAEKLGLHDAHAGHAALTYLIKGYVLSAAIGLNGLRYLFGVMELLADGVDPAARTSHPTRRCAPRSWKTR